MFEAEKIDAIPVAHARVRVDEKPSPLITALILALGDYFAVYGAYAAAVAIRDLFQGELSRQLYLSLWPLLLLFPLSYYLSGLYQFGVALPEELRRLTYATVINFCVLGAVTFLYKVGVLYSRGVFVIAFGLTLVTVPLSRILLRGVFARMSWWGRAVVVLGAGKTGSLVVKKLLSQPELGLKPVALLDDKVEMHGQLLYGIPIVGPLSLATQFAEGGIRVAVLAIPGVDRFSTLQIIQNYANLFQHLILIPDLFGLSSLWVQTQDLGGILGLEIQQNLLSTEARLIKRAIDLSLIIFFSPIILLIVSVFALLIKLDSPGSAFYKSRRIGQDGKLINILKFRSMVKDADEILKDYLRKNPHLQSEWQTSIKLKDDPRVTRIGQFLRKTSLDELPQVWNVLKGEMSLVGPRPILEEEVNRYEETFEIYTQVKPGITGYWQVMGRNDVPYEERKAMVSYYVRNWSPWLDLVILAKTVWVVLTGKGAY
ncbi:MAG: Undecaprenyl-phosphate galactosephosphotransferase [Anaerolineae bacterium]|jgi:Undecaprenyl-phosphate galactose phosphotransferase WbaP|nr:MAG: Undecaprenyl-phosphate galactosephosphotransferase [Anaerolineae bacterium]